MRNRTEPAEPNRTVEFQNRPETDVEPNRTEMSRTRPNRVEPGNIVFRTEPIPSCYYDDYYHYHTDKTHMDGAQVHVLERE